MRVSSIVTTTEAKEGALAVAEEEEVEMVEGFKTKQISVDCMADINGRIAGKIT